MNDKEPKQYIITLFGHSTEFRTDFFRSFKGDKYQSVELSVKGTGYPSIENTGLTTTQYDFTLNETPINLIISDKKGTDLNYLLHKIIFMESSAGILTFRKNDRQSFTVVPEWKAKFEEFAASTPLILVGFSSDSDIVSTKEAHSLANDLNIPYLECIPTDPDQVLNILTFITRQLINKE